MRARALVAGLCVCAVLSSTPPALGQPADAETPPPAPAPTTAPAAAPPAAPAIVAPEDEALAPVSAPPKTLTGWREAVALASAEDLDYSVSVLEIERLEGVKRQTLAGTLPTLNAQGSLAYSYLNAESQLGKVETDEVNLSASITFRQPLIAPRTWWAIGTADAQVELAKTSTEDKKRILIASVADAIVTVVTAERQSEVNRVAFKASQDRLRLMKKRKELGAGSDLDIVRFKQDLVLSRSGVITADETLHRARERLALAVGVTGEVGVRPDISIDDIEDTLARACDKGELAGRADLRALKAQRDISARALTDADLLYVPTADLLSTFNYGTDVLSGDNSLSFSIQGVLSVPIWDGGARYGVRRAAAAVVKQQDERLDAAMRSASIEVSQADRAVLVAEQNLEVATVSRDLAKENDDLVRKAFAEGATGVTTFEIVDAARRLREAEVALTVRELELVRSKITAMLSTSNCAASP